jgi:methyl-accepting chemotaxis protein
MTQKNKESADHANSLMKAGNQIVSKANGAMTELNQSMIQISEASQETSKIVKTIDEIAFQTNLLALNAAVEAARAGEAGAGFAVVADEVRNLAMRAADAAKHTSEMIANTVMKVQGGADLVAKTNEAFSEVAINTSKVGTLLDEIAAASAEQAQGIERINQTVSEMDKVTQQNAANSEESASASDQLHELSERVQLYVDELATLVGSRNKPDQSNKTDLKETRKSKLDLVAWWGRLRSKAGFFRHKTVDSPEDSSTAS